MIDFTGAKAITIPEGSVKKITSSGVVLWEKPEALKNYFIPEEATLNVRMGSSSMSTQNGYVWTGAIPVDLTKESPFRIKVEGTKIADVKLGDTDATYQKLWLCADNTGTTKLSAAVLLKGNNSSNYAPLDADGVIHADYKGGAKLSNSIITGTKYIRIGFKFSNAKINSVDELKNVKITIPSDIEG